MRSCWVPLLLFGYVGVAGADEIDFIDFRAGSSHEATTFRGVEPFRTDVPVVVTAAARGVDGRTLLLLDAPARRLDQVEITTGHVEDLVDLALAGAVLPVDVATAGGRIFILDAERGLLVLEGDRTVVVVTLSDLGPAVNVLTATGDDRTSSTSTATVIVAGRGQLGATAQHLTIDLPTLGYTLGPRVALAGAVGAAAGLELGGREVLAVGGGHELVLIDLAGAVVERRTLPHVVLGLSTLNADHVLVTGPAGQITEVRLTDRTMRSRGDAQGYIEAAQGMSPSILHVAGTDDSRPAPAEAKFIRPGAGSVALAGPAGVRVDVGDILGTDASGLPGDGRTDLITSRYSVTGGNTDTSYVRIHEPLPGGGYAERASFSPYGTHGYGATVAAAHLVRDPLDPTQGSEILTGAGPAPANGPQVRGWRGNLAPIPGINFYGYGTLRYGVNVAAPGESTQRSDLPFSLIVTGPGPGVVFGPHARAWQYNGISTQPIPNFSFYAYFTLRYGLEVAAGDLDIDGMPEVVTGPGPGGVFGAHVRGFNWDRGPVTSIPSINFALKGAETGTGAMVPARYGARVCLWEEGTFPQTEYQVGAIHGPDPALSDSNVTVFSTSGAAKRVAGAGLNSSFLGSNAR